jgi:tetratricopeptide (TPR) repeat protein
MSPGRILGASIIALAAAACAPMAEKATPTPSTAPVAPQVTESQLRDRAKDQLAQGIRQYNAGEFESAQKNLNASLEHGLLSKPDQSTARKHLAFIHCLVNRESQCRDEFRKAFEINPDFALSAAEDGHPIWGPVYRSVRTQLIAESEAKQALAKPSAAGKAEKMLVDGMVKYEAGDYEAALKLLEGATKEGLKEKSDQVRALKHTAFCLCLLNKYPPCRATFIRIYEINPDFDLTPAEAGHPSWTKTFAGAKAEAKRALAAKQKATTTAKDKAPAPPAAAQTPPKK